MKTGRLEKHRPTAETAIPRVSIVVPVYNGEKYLRESLDSILAQTFRDIEVIVMDDASTDTSAEIVASYDDPRLIYWRQPVNRGIFPNLDDGIARARGSLIALHHADDVYHAEIVAREVDYLDKHPAVGAVFAIDTFIDPDGVEYGRLELPAEFSQTRPLTYSEVLNGFLRHGNAFIRGGTSMVRREVHETVGRFAARYELRADLDMWLRIVGVTPIAILPDHLVAYRWGHENSSARYDRLRREPELSFAVLDAALDAGSRPAVEPDSIRAYEARRAEDRLVITANLYILGDRSAARSALATASAARIVASRKVQRWRLLVLWGSLHILTRLPRIPVIATALYRRFGAR